MLTMLMVNKDWESCCVDMEMAFLHGEFEEGEVVHMECPPGMEATKLECLLLLKTAYGLCQGARAFFLKLKKALTELGFLPSDADLCLFVKVGPSGTVIIGVCVDDLLVIGDKIAMDEAIAG